MENDLSVVILNQDGDRIDVIAKGAGTPASKRRAHLEPINLIDCTLYYSRNHIYLHEVKCIKSFVNLKSNLDSITQTQKLLQIIEKNTYPENPDARIFDLMLETIECFNQADPHPLSLEMALIKLANIMGILPNFIELELKYRKAIEFFKVSHSSSLKRLTTNQEENNTIKVAVQNLF
ncbi:MAG: DNA repair protein RecO [Candidatus Gracilibacteria bacterium]